MTPFSALDTVRWATGRASGLQKVGCWFVGGDDLT